MDFQIGRFSLVSRLLFAAVLLATLRQSAFAAEQDKPSAPFGLEKRTAWTTSRVVGSPDPAPPLKAVRAFEKLSFANPLYIIAEPGAAKGQQERLLVVEQHGKLLAFANDPGPEKVGPEKVSGTDFLIGS
ncbi:MAG TPA: hypothetical protein VMV10_01500 [Pirellulales bacterium]|nr:hypothetical protein [Pirellulales bacterium]